jgi:hypothetical protein
MVKGNFLNQPPVSFAQFEELSNRVNSLVEIMNLFSASLDEFKAQKKAGRPPKEKSADDADQEG